ncbi:uncharacterized protein [Macrobrachium rosenbergii]|uniref:uncharacterized protein n=1 Tax=Macrobrachium rosenbergii TaxID=79674 RepID=UPI0034D70303
MPAFCFLYYKYRQNDSTYFFTVDKTSTMGFLVDTSAFKSFVSANPHKRFNPTPSTLQASTASGDLLKIYRRRTIKVSFSGKQYNWTFVTAEITITLLGADFLNAHNVLVDVAKQQLITKPTPLASFTPTPAPEISHILQECLEAFKDDLQHGLNKPTKHHIQHHIVTYGPPVHARFRCLAPEKLTHAKQAFWDMEHTGICQKPPALGISPTHNMKT